MWTKNTLIIILYDIFLHLKNYYLRKCYYHLFDKKQEKQSLYTHTLIFIKQIRLVVEHFLFNA